MKSPSPTNQNGMMHLRFRKLDANTPAIVQGVIFQMLWFITVWGAAQRLWWLGPLGIACFSIIQLKTFAHRHELKLILTTVFYGFVIDSSLMLFKVISFPHEAPPYATFLSPIWMISLWANLALSLNHSLSWLTRMKNNLAVIAMTGLISGPLSYYAGMRLGAISIEWPMLQGMIMLGIIWGVSLPALYLLNQRLIDSVASPDKPNRQIAGGIS